MKPAKWFFGALAVVCLSVSAQSVSAQGRKMFKGHVVTPESSVEHPKDIGVKAHTHYQIMMPNTGRFEREPGTNELPPVLGLFFETPASLACVYRLVPNPRHGCNPDETTANPSGGSKAIALVDAFHDPNAQADLDTFSDQFGLPRTTLTVVSVGPTPPTDPTGNAEVETSLDIEYAHAMAPNAQLFLVESQSLHLGDLLDAIVLAGTLVLEAGGGEVSMSFGGGEFPQETQIDPLAFNAPNVVYVASSGDFPGVQWPCASTRVVCAGGTTISRNSSTGEFLVENSWQDTGGGPSQFEPRPSFQDRIARMVGATRGTPDLSFDANPNTGVWVFDSFPFEGQTLGWIVVGGTSVSAPSLSGIINAAGHFAPSSQAENREIYEHLRDPLAFRDIVFGNCGLNIGDFATLGWDFCTGVGSDTGHHGK